MTDSDAAVVFLVDDGLKWTQILKKNESKSQGSTDRKDGPARANWGAQFWHNSTENVG